MLYLVFYVLGTGIRFYDKRVMFFMLLRIMIPYFWIFPFKVSIPKIKLECPKKNKPPVQGAILKHSRQNKNVFSNNLHPECIISVFFLIDIHVYR